MLTDIVFAKRVFSLLAIRSRTRHCVWDWIRDALHSHRRNNTAILRCMFIQLARASINGCTLTT